MDSHWLTRWLTLGANIGVLIGIVLLIVELDQNRDMMRAQTRHELSMGIVDLLQTPAENEQLADVLFRARSGEKLSPSEAFQFELRTNALFRYWEDVHYQYRVGLYDDIEFARQRGAWKNFFNTPHPGIQYWCRVRTFYSPEFMAEMDSLLVDDCDSDVTAVAQFQRTDIHDEANQVQPLLPGMKAAGFDVLDVQGNPVHFDPENMNKPLVLTFFRGGWCPYCNLHLAELRKAEEELTASGFDIWFISIDQPEVLYESLDQPDIGYTILSDSKLSATRAFGLAFRVADELVERYLEWNIDLEGASGESHHVLPAPATFIIGSDGIIQFQFTNPDYKLRLHPEVLLAAARVYTDGANDRLQREHKASQ